MSGCSMSVEWMSVCMDVRMSIWMKACLSLCKDEYLSELLSVCMSHFFSIWLSVLMSEKQYGCLSGYLCVWFAWCLKQLSVVKKDWSEVLNNCSVCLDVCVAG